MRLPMTAAAARIACTLALLCVVGCKKGEAPEAFHRWAAGDSFFSRDPGFPGGGAAYSVDLGGDHVLWLFGDSFVGPEVEPGSRSQLPMTRNALALQHGRDPTTGSIEFFADAEPFFAHPDSDRWFWPGPGVRVYDLQHAISEVDPLVLGLAEIREASGGLGFETVGSKLAVIDDPLRPPAEWTVQIVDWPENSHGIQLGLGAWWPSDSKNYLFAPVEPGNHDVYLARWDDAQLLADRKPKLVWWNGAAWSDDEASAQPIVRGLQTEFSVHQEWTSSDPDNGKLWMISTEGFGGSRVVLRTADKPSGPWSKPRLLATPPEASREGILIYSAKAHPALRVPGLGGPMVTYCTNHTDFGTMVGDMDLYFPRFVVAKD